MKPLTLLRTTLAVLSLQCFYYLSYSDVDQLPNLIVVDFDSSDSSYSNLPEKISEMIQDGAIESGLFNVLERDKLKTLLREQGWSNSGMVESSTAIQMGNMVGANYILTGKIISIDQEEKRFSGYGVNTVTTIVTLRAKAQIMETGTGRIVFSKSCKAETTIYEGGGLRNSNTGAFVDLAEKISKEIVVGIRRSNQFKITSDEPEMILVQVTSIPEMADVEVDGVFYGNASGEMSLPKGLHSVKISIPGYIPWEKKIMVSPTTKVLARLKEEVQTE